MSEYIKIQTLWLRDPATNHKTLLRGEWAKPEFQYLASALWVWTEKVDGTNIRVIWDGERVRFGGKTDAAQVPTPLLAHLMDVFTPERLAAALKGPLVLYGEGYGPKIQKGGGRYRDDPGFILFDALAVDTWLERGTVEEIAGALAIPVAPIIGSGSLWEAAAIVEDGYLSQIAKDPTLTAEGFVMRPAVELKNRRGERVIAKVKHNDFASSHILADSQSGRPGGADVSEIRPADPGSLKARMHGCICYELDTPGAFAINSECPMHGRGLDPKAWQGVEGFLTHDSDGRKRAENLQPTDEKKMSGGGPGGRVESP